MAARENFGSRLTVIFAMAGSAIGLGNIWRFPYMVGQNGGAAFIIVYLLSAMILCIPIFLSESIIGKRTQLSTFGAMDALAPGTKWKWIGGLTVFTPLIIISYYSVVGGWSIDYFLRSLTFAFSDPAISQDQHSAIFGNFVSSAWGPLFFHTLFMGINALVVMAGVKAGIEKFTKITTPVLFVLVVVIMIYSLTLPGASAGIEYMLKPDFSKLTGSAMLSAMGQSFFSLSLGVGCILTYASYIKKSENILSTGLYTAGFDIIFALIAGFAIMPAVFAAGIEPGAGPGLIFETLPFIFSTMGTEARWLSNIIAILFFLTILFAALTSSISMLETGVAYLVDEKKMKRSKATLILFSGCWLLGVFCSLSFGPLSNFHILGETIFNFCDKLTSNFLMTFGSLMFVLFLGWKMKKADVRSEFTNDGSLKFNSKIFEVFYFLVRFVAPVVIVTIFITTFIIS